MSQDIQHIYYTQTSGDFKVAKIRVQRVTPKLYHIGHYAEYELLFDSSQYENKFLSVGVQLSKDSLDVHLTLESAISRIVSVINRKINFHEQMLFELNNTSTALKQFELNCES